jgi:hypothetical protein
MPVGSFSSRIVIRVWLSAQAREAAVVAVAAANREKKTMRCAEAKRSGTTVSDRK